MSGCPKWGDGARYQQAQAREIASRGISAEVDMTGSIYRVTDA